MREIFFMRVGRRAMLRASILMSLPWLQAACGMRPPSGVRPASATARPTAPSPVGVDVQSVESAESIAVEWHPSVVVLWNEAMLAAVRNGAPRPTVIARSLYMVHQAMYDAWAMVDATALPAVLDVSLRRPAGEHTLENKAAAVSRAAYVMLTHLFSAYEAQTGAFARLLRNLGYVAAPASDLDTPEGVGLAAASAVLAARSGDGSNAENDYVDVVSESFPTLYAPVNNPDPAAPNSPGHAAFNPDRWQPLRVPTGAVYSADGYPVVDPTNPASYRDQVFLTPHWGAVQPFALSTGSQFRPAHPPHASSDAPYTDALGRRMTNAQAYAGQTDEILTISATLSDRQKVIAEYWADGPRSETPPGHWNALAHGICMRDRHTVDEDVKLFFALNGALFDASIAAWDAKRHYDCVRPVSAIQHRYAGQTIPGWGGPDKGTQLIPAEQWAPYQDPTFVTPPFAEYVSGHSTFSAAAAAVLTMFTGSNRFYDGETMLYGEDFNRDGIPDMLGQHVVRVGGNQFEHSPSEVIVLQWATFQQAADEAGLSRRYGGIHFQDADLRAREMGRDIGILAYDVAEKYWLG